MSGKSSWDNANKDLKVLNPFLVNFCWCCFFEVGCRTKVSCNKIYTIKKRILSYSTRTRKIGKIKFVLIFFFLIFLFAQNIANDWFSFHLLQKCSKYVLYTFCNTKRGIPKKKKNQQQKKFDKKNYKVHDINSHGLMSNNKSHRVYVLSVYPIVWTHCVALCACGARWWKWVYDNDDV